MTELERCKLAKEKGYIYNPITGELRGVKGNVLKAKSEGYIHCKIYHENEVYNVMGHRIAWYLYYGELPENQIDHIDGNRTNNKIDNLRDVTSQQNAMNRTKAKGYSFCKRSNKFFAYIMIKGKGKSLGYHNTEAEAHNAYLEAKNKYYAMK